MRDVLGERTFDLVVATYGRLRLLVDVLAGRTGRMVTIGGTVYERQRWSRPADETASAAAMGAEIELVNYPRAAGRPVYFWGGGRNLESMGSGGPPPTHHKLLDGSRIRAELGYRDIVGFEDAIARTVEWYMKHPLERGGPDERRIGDPFDYAAEDRFAAALAEFVAGCGRLDFAGVTLTHSYDHPKSA